MENHIEEIKQKLSSQKAQTAYELSGLERNPEWEKEKVLIQINALRRK